ncbi:MAG TPA: secondary thiamine-phosphate synthase enzyme YjbQ [Miltoncostaeaceae bacterium]|nr:secondary thiamine-phosphate synthase enzyme YjbQ [Miltoncostaeaceae bacterium]
MVWVQRRVVLAPRPRGVHLVTREVLAEVPELRAIRVGLLHVFIRHTSASLTLNENASPDVRGDLERWMRDAVPDGAPYLRHTLEGDDDMPAHVKASLFGASVTVPLAEGRPLLGTWQGLHLCEHRVHGGPRELVVTAWGEARDGDAGA